METPVYKYQLGLYGGCLSLPRDSQLLTVCVQYGRPVLYVKMGTASTCELIISSCGTGYSPSLKGAYIGTAMLENGTLVVHYFAAWRDDKKASESTLR